MMSKEEAKWLELLKKPALTEEARKEKLLAGEEFSRYLRAEMQSLSKELKLIGSNFSYPWDMVNSKKKYSESIDILIKHLSKPYHDKNKEGIIRALTVKEAKGKANQVLLSEYKNIPKEKENLRWVIGNAFTVIIVEKDVEEIIKIVKSKDNGTSRSSFITALGKIRSEQIEDVLIQLLDDEEVVLDVLIALGKIRSQKAKKQIALMTTHPDPAISKEAKKALKKIP